MMISVVNVNYLAVFIAALFAMVLGGVWYSPLLFGKYWMKLTKMDAKKIEEAKKKGMAASYLLQFVAALVTAYVLAHFVAYTESTTVLAGMQTGFWIWLGFFATTSISSILWEGKPKELYLLNNAHHLILLMAMGAILAVW